MGWILCLIGFHDWGGQFNIRGGLQGRAAILFALFDYRKCDRRCLRCGKVSQFVYDARR